MYGGKPKMPKILILTGDAAEALEVIYPHQRLREEGYEVVIASLTKKLMSLVVHEFVPGVDTFVEKPGYHWPSDVAFSDVDPSEYAAVVIPGGRAPEYIRNNPDFVRIVRHFFEEKKPVAHLCHASIALATAGVLRGRRIAAYPELQPDVEAAGAKFVNAEVVVDGTMISARAYPDHPAWMREFVRALRKYAPVSPAVAVET
jgi:protease I